VKNEVFSTNKCNFVTYGWITHNKLTRPVYIFRARTSDSEHSYRRSPLS